MIIPDSLLIVSIIVLLLVLRWALQPEGR